MSWVIAILGGVQLGMFIEKLPELNKWNAVSGIIFLTVSIFVGEK